MASTDNQDLFEHYYQKEYDFNTTTLTEDEVRSIKRLVREKRVDYNLAPIGEEIFEWILSQEHDLSFEFVDFDSEKIDGMLYIPSNGKEKAYIILNSNKPLINQIFTAAHEYYHYICDYSEIKSKPYVCDFSSLKNVNEKKASRFAAEFLLPEDALRAEIRFLESRFRIKDYAYISILLTIKYQLPLKAVIYRLYEERYIDDIENYIKNYSFIKEILKEIKIATDRVERLYSTDNPYCSTNGLIYKEMRDSYLSGLASREEIISDARTLGLDETIVNDFFSDFEEDDDEDDSEVLDIIKKKWGKKE